MLCFGFEPLSYPGTPTTIVFKCFRTTCSSCQQSSPFRPGNLSTEATKIKATVISTRFPTLNWFVHDQCDQIGYLWKVLVTNFLTKEAQISCDFLGYFTIEVKTGVALFWATFYSRIWSHCNHDTSLWMWLMKGSDHNNFTLVSWAS